MCCPIPANFKMSEKTNVTGYPPPEDKSDLIFITRDRKRDLSIASSKGWILYHDYTAAAPVLQQPHDVPSDEETLRLGLYWLRQFGIDRSQLATKPGTDQLRIFHVVQRQEWLDEKSGRSSEVVSHRGINFIRRVDDYDIQGIGPWGGACLMFANYGKIFSLEIVWRGLEPFQLIPTLSPQDIWDLIKQRTDPMGPRKHGPTANGYRDGNDPKIPRRDHLR